MGGVGLAGCGQPGWKEDSEMQSGKATKGDLINLSPVLPEVFFFCQVLFYGKVGWKTIEDDSSFLCLYVFK